LIQADQVVSFPISASGALPIAWELIGGTRTQVGDSYGWGRPYIGGGLPSGVWLDPYTGQLAGTATATSIGSYNFQIRASNSYGTSANKSLTLTIFDDGIPDSQNPSAKLGPPVIQTKSLPRGMVGKQWNQYEAQTFIVCTGAKQGRSFSYTGTLPDGLTLNTATGEISGIPTTVGTFSFTVTASNVAGSSSPQAYSVSIVSSGSALPVINSRSLPINSAGEKTYFSYALGGYNLTGVVWSVISAGATLSSGLWTGGGVPLGYSVDAATGVITVSNTTVLSSSALPGINYFKVRATTGAGTDEAWITMMATVDTPIVLSMNPTVRAWNLKE
jgi:hypothetical protein